MVKYIFLLLFSAHLYSAHINVAIGNSVFDESTKLDAKVSMQIWIQSILEDTEHTASFTFYDTPLKMVKAFNLGKIDMVLAKPFDFVKYFDKSEIKQGFSVSMKNKIEDDFVIVTRQNQSLEDIYTAKPIIALPENEEISKILVKYMFLKKGKKQKINFLETTKHNTALLKLFFKKADAAVVSKKAFDFANELNPQIGKKLKIVYQSNISSETFSYFRKDFDKDAHEKILELAINLKKTNKTKQILMILKTENIIKNNIEDLKPIEELYHNYIKLKEAKK